MNKKIKKRKKKEKGAIMIILALIMAVMFTVIVISSSKSIIREKKRTGSSAPSAVALQKGEEAAECLISYSDTNSSEIYNNCKTYIDDNHLKIYKESMLTGEYVDITADVQTGTVQPQAIKYIEGIGKAEYAADSSGNPKFKQRKVKVKISIPAPPADELESPDGPLADFLNGSQNFNINPQQAISNAGDYLITLINNAGASPNPEDNPLAAEYCFENMNDLATNPSNVNFNKCSAYDSGLFPNTINGANWCVADNTRNNIRSNTPGTLCNCIITDSANASNYFNSDEAINNEICSPCNMITDDPTSYPPACNDGSDIAQPCSVGAPYSSNAWGTWLIFDTQHAKIEETSGTIPQIDISNGLNGNNKCFCKQYYNNNKEYCCTIFNIADVCCLDGTNYNQDKCELLSKMKQGAIWKNIDDWKDSIKDIYNQKNITDSNEQCDFCMGIQNSNPLPDTEGLHLEDFCCPSCNAWDESNCENDPNNNYEKKLNEWFE